MKQAKITQAGYEALENWLAENHRHSVLNVDVFASEAEDKWAEGDTALVVELKAHEAHCGKTVTFSPEFEIIEIED